MHKTVIERQIEPIIQWIKIWRNENVHTWWHNNTWLIVQLVR